jgi:hypothetical protein
MAQDMDETPQLDPTELYDKRRSKDMYRLKAYNKILEQIYTRIRVISKLPNSVCYLVYTVPPFIFGLPKIDLEDCVIYIIHQLRHSKYEVRFTYPNMLYISWMHHEKSYIVDQSPIMRSMMASFEKTEQEKEASRLLYSKKSQKKVRMQMPGEMQRKMPVAAINNILQPRPVAAPPIVSAADYVPPSSFLQNISAPSSSAPQPKSTMDYFGR